jgi:hypothetical protein
VACGLREACTDAGIDMRKVLRLLGVSHSKCTYTEKAEQKRDKSDFHDLVIDAPTVRGVYKSRQVGWFSQWEPQNRYGGLGRTL